MANLQLRHTGSLHNSVDPTLSVSSMPLDHFTTLCFWGNFHSLSALPKKPLLHELASTTTTIVSAIIELVYHYEDVGCGGLLLALTSSAAHHGDE